MKKLLLLFLILLILCSCEFDAEPGIITYTFFWPEHDISMLVNECVDNIENGFENVKMVFDAALLRTAELKFLPSELYEHLLKVTNEHNIYEWIFQAINDGFEFVGTGFS
jgi:hypothetical protein